MKELVFTFALYTILTACGGPSQENTPNTTSANSDAMSQSTDIDGSHVCYLHIHERDSVHLELRTKGDSIQGSLFFNNYQIDDSRGIIRGRFKGDTLFVVYDFMAEGMHNQTEEAFLKRGDSLIRGFGDRQMINETMTYQKSANINFNKGQVFHPVSCL